MTERREMSVRPAFHRCDPDPSKDYGIHCAELTFTLHVDDDAISWAVFTGWGLPDDAFQAAVPDCGRHPHGWPNIEPVGGAVDWHMSTPSFDNHDRIDHCVVLDGPCYPDVGYLVGSDLFDLLRTDGDEAVWLKMRDLLADYRAEVAALFEEDTA